MFSTGIDFMVSDGLSWVGALPSGGWCTSCLFLPAALLHNGPTGKNGAKYGYCRKPADCAALHRLTFSLRYRAENQSEDFSFVSNSFTLMTGLISRILRVIIINTGQVFRLIIYPK